MVDTNRNINRVDTDRIIHRVDTDRIIHGVNSLVNSHRNIPRMMDIDTTITDKIINKSNQMTHIDQFQTWDIFNTSFF